jgi:hypothetical protein
MGEESIVRKNLILVTLSLLIIVATASADSINFGDTLTWSSSPYRDTSFNGGPFLIKDQNTGVTFETFCLEKTEYLSNPMTVSSISNEAVMGSTSSSDPLDQKTEVLVYAWFNNLLGVPKSIELGRQIQEAIWFIEEEPNVSANSWVTWAANNVATYGSLASPSVAVINPTYVDASGAVKKGQSQAFYMPVPEPTLILLLGISLFAISGLAIKMK